MKYLSITVLLAITVLGTSCTKDDVSEPVTPAISDIEREDLLLLYEEEKMARDLYMNANDLHAIIQFENISASEQIHMDAVGELLDLFQIEVPVSDERGEFTITEIHELFITLNARMQSSLTEALEAAALVEETDIADIRIMNTRTENSEILNVLERLECASGNHLQAFTTKLKSEGITYTPVVLSADEYNTVLNAGHRHCGK